MGVSREKLFAEVWAEPMTAVAARYGVSSSFLARVCERLRVPRPERGYWEKKKAGKAGPQPALPAAQPGDELAWVRDGESERVPLPPPRAPEQLPQEPPAPARGRKGAHPLLMGLQAHLEAGQRTKSGYLKPARRAIADLQVTASTLKRALDLLQRFFGMLEGRGHRVVLATLHPRLYRPAVAPLREAQPASHLYESHRYSDTWAPDRPTVVYVGTVAIGLSLYEESERYQGRDGKELQRIAQRNVTGSIEEDSFQFWSVVPARPTGRLVLRASSPYPGVSWEQVWREGRPGELQPRLGEVVLALEQAAGPIAQRAQEEQQRAEERRREYEAQQREWARKQEEARLVQATQASRTQLLGLIEEWATACRIEQFLKQAVQEAQGLPAPEGEAQLARLEQARKLLGNTQALARFRRWKAPNEH